MTRHGTGRPCALGWAILLLAVLPGLTRGAFLTTESFSGNDGSWVDRDGGEMTVGYTGTAGNPSGSLQGSFDLQDSPSPETDAFRADAFSSGGAFAGDYWTDVPGFSTWTFSFYADDVLPSDVIVRFGDGVSTFSYNVSAQVTALDTWTTVVVPLSYGSWLGGSATAFSNALGGVQFVDVQVSRSGTGAQDYFLDNFALNGPSSTSVPEPATAGLLLAAVGVLRLARGMKRREAGPRGSPAGASPPRRRPRRRLPSALF